MGYSSVGIVTGYKLDGPGSIPGLARFSPLHSHQTDSGAHTASHPMVTGDNFPVVKRLGLESGQLPASSAEVMNGGAIPRLPDMP
jgi:hypothetical protein